MSYEDMSKAAVLEAEAGHLVETIERLTRERDAARRGAMRMIVREGVLTADVERLERDKRRLAAAVRASQHALIVAGIDRVAVDKMTLVLDEVTA